MRRRGVGALAGCLAIIGPSGLRAQSRRVPVIGVLGASTEANWAPWTAAFVGRLEALGWAQGRNAQIIYRWAEGRAEEMSRIAEEFSRMPVDVILTVGGSTQVAMRATTKIPIVFAVSVDPVGSGLVASLSRPGGNVTGLSIQGTELAGKRIEILREAMPGLRRLAILGNVSYEAANLEVREARAAAARIGIDAIVAGIRKADDIAAVFATMPSDVQALYVCPDPLVNANQAQINALALNARLPTMHPFRDYLGSDGLLSYGPNNIDLFRRAADYVDRILRGAKPGDLPVEQPTRFELVVNMRSARLLGVTIPPGVMARVDDIID